MNRLYICVLISLFCLSIQGQSIREQIKIPKIKQSKSIREDVQIKSGPKTKERTNPITQSSQSTLSKDTVYSIANVKRNGWFLPLGEITKDQANHRMMTLMFTGKNKQGNWTKIELINSYGQYAHGLGIPYILGGVSDSAADSEWIRRCYESCIIEIISDPSGLEVIQERVYDSNHNLIYEFSHTPIGVDENGNKQYLGSYRDIYGLPAEMRISTGHTYGTVVKITQDKWGYCHKIEFLDPKGIHKLNADSVFCSVHEFNEQGDKLSFGSQNEMGEYVIDSWGNCGVVTTCNNDHTIASSMYVDNNWNPMPMPSNKSLYHLGVIKIKYQYDGYKRCIEEKFVYPDDKPMTNYYGTHIIKFEYDNNGNLIKQFGLDCNNQLCQLDETGIAIIKSEYDNKGRLKEQTFLGKDSTLFGTKNSLTKVKKDYDGKGNLSLEERYSMVNGTERIFNKFEATPKYRYTQIADTIRIDSLDSKGRITFMGLYDKDHNLINKDNRAYEVWSYIDKKGSTLQTKIFYNQDKKEAEFNGISKSVTLIDSIKWSMTTWNYNSNGQLVQTFRNKFTPHFIKPIGQDDINIFGVTSRCGGVDAKYCSANFVYNQDGKSTFIYGRDEFNEPDYIMNSHEVYSYKKGFPNGTIKSYDASNNEITGNNIQLKIDSIPKVMSIEIIDSCAYKRGLKDNDVILLYGNYKVNLDSVIKYTQHINNWALRSVLDAHDPKRMVVFRVIDAKNKEYGLFEIKDLCGTPTELGFIPHNRFLTDKQIRRIKKSIAIESAKPNPILTNDELNTSNNSEGLHLVMICYPDMYLHNRSKLYSSQVADPSILLGACIKDRLQKWSKDDGENMIPLYQMFHTSRNESFEYTQQDYYFTTDSKSIIPLKVTESPLNTFQNISFDFAYISESDYEKVEKLYQNVCDSINNKISLKRQKIDKHLIGRWVVKPDFSIEYQPETYVNIYKDGSYCLSTINYGRYTFNYTTYVFSIKKEAVGFLVKNGNWLYFNPTQENVNVACVEIESDQNEATKQLMIDEVNKNIQLYQYNIILNSNYIEPKIGEDMYIMAVDKKQLTTKYNNGSIITLYKYE